MVAMCTIALAWRSVDNLEELTLCFFLVGLRDQVQVKMLSSSLYTLNHLTSPKTNLKKV